jgi:hypothetical protein
MSYGKLRPGTALFRPMLWLLHVKLLAQNPPFGSGTPHCLSTSTGPLGFAPLALGSSFFFFFAFGPFSAPSSIFRFLPFFAPSPSITVPLMADLRAPIPTSSSSPFSFRKAASLASLASFFFLSFSCFLFKHSRMCDAEEVRRTGRRQCLHCTVSTLSSSGRPLGKPAMVFSSRGLTEGDAVLGAGALFSASCDMLACYLQAMCRHASVQNACCRRHTNGFALLPVASNRRPRHRLLDLEGDPLPVRLQRVFYCV